MNCPFCKKIFDGERNYCGACGKQLVHYCSLCGFKNRIDDKFCGNCGVELGSGQVARPVHIDSKVLPSIITQDIEKTSTSSASGQTDSDLAELMEIAEESKRLNEVVVDSKVSQDDIDALFGE